MTAACREACCSVTPRLTVSELFERGFRRSRTPPLPVEGDPCTDAEGHSASFSLDIADGKIAAVGFRASSCATLIAYCELIAELVPGFGLEIARGLTAQNLAASLPGVPPLKRERAVLAIAAFRSALVAAEENPPTFHRHPEERASTGERASKDGGHAVALRGSATASPRTSG